MFGKRPALQLIGRLELIKAGDLINEIAKESFFKVRQLFVAMQSWIDSTVNQNNKLYTCK